MKKIAPSVHERVSNGLYEHFDGKWKVVREVKHIKDFDKKAKRMIERPMAVWIPYKKNDTGQYTIENEVEADDTLMAVISKINVAEGYSHKIRSRTTGQPLLPKSVDGRKKAS